jgi:hypothetical protein
VPTAVAHGCMVCGSVPGGSRRVRLNAQRDCLGYLGDGVIERLPHRLRHGCGIAVPDIDARVERPLEEPPAARILQCDGEGDVRGLRRCEHVIEREHVDVKDDCLRVVRQPEPRRRAEAGPERTVDVVCGQVEPPALLVEAVLDLGHAPHDALTQEALALDAAEAQRDAARGGRVCLVPGGFLERRRAGPEEAGWIRGAK